MAYVEGVERTQSTLFPQSLDEYITVENPVRFVDAFVAGLDLDALGFERAVPAETGRPGYNPGDLLRVYIYGYLHHLRSSRVLERECERNVEVMWLVRKLRPDFKTIADFRKDNREAIRQVCREFTLLCRRLELFGSELVAVDSSSFKAVNNPERNFTVNSVNKELKKTEERIEKYLKELDRNDAEVQLPPRYTAEELQTKIAKLKNRKEAYAAVGKVLEQTGASQLSTTDADCRAITRGANKTVVGYQLQAAVDSKHGLIVEHEVTNAVSDHGQLAGIATQAKATLGVDQLDAVADRGYCDGGEIKACVEAGITPYVPKSNTSANRKLGLFGKDVFRYDAAHDLYRCPAGAELTYRFQTRELGRDIRYYSTEACRQCALKPRCTRNQSNRRITRWVDEHLVEQSVQRLRERPDMLKQRMQLAEHPFGVLKHSFGFAEFLMRGLGNVRAEMGLSVLAFNLRRAISILGVPRLMAAVAP